MMPTRFIQICLQVLVIEKIITNPKFQILFSLDKRNHQISPTTQVHNTYTPTTQLYERCEVYNSSQSMILQSMFPWMLIVI